MALITNKDGIALFYEDYGSGKPVVLVHGWGMNGDTWEYVMRVLLQHGLRCIAYDLRGCGRSDKPWGSYDYSTLAGDLAALIEALDLQDITLVGHAMGCGVITRYLYDHGQARVGGAVFLGTTTPYLLRADDNPEGMDKSFFDNMIEAIIKDRPGFVTGIGQGFFTGNKDGIPVPTPLSTWAFGIVMQSSPFAATEFIRTTSGTDQREDLKKITIPVLIIHGGATSGAPISLTAERTLGYLPNARLLVYEGSSGGFYITEGERTGKDILEFMGSL
jgi:non-heme chloroperoxidase